MINISVCSIIVIKLNIFFLNKSCSMQLHSVCLLNYFYNLIEQLIIIIIIIVYFELYIAKIDKTSTCMGRNFAIIDYLKQ